MSRAGLASTLIRVFCGVVFIAHGVPKILNLQSTMEWFSSIGLPAWSAVIVAVIEVLGGLSLLVGFMTIPLAVVFIAEMVVAILKVHASRGFLASNGGYEFSLAMIVMLFAVILLGPGLSVDGIRSRKTGAGSSTTPVTPEADSTPAPEAGGTTGHN